MRIWLKKTLTGFAPADQASTEAWRKYKAGEVYRADVVKPRSYQHHKLCMALLNMTYENLPEQYAGRWPSFSSFRKAVAREAGHTTEYVSIDGEICIEAGSLSYDALPDDVAFGEVFGDMMKLRDSPRDLSCVRCGTNDGTVVLAHYMGPRRHSYGGGMGHKGNDAVAAMLCAACHRWADTLSRNKDKRWELSEEFLHCCALTWIRWLELGVLK